MCCLVAVRRRTLGLGQAMDDLADFQNALDDALFEGVGDVTATSARALSDRSGGSGAGSSAGTLVRSGRRSSAGSPASSGGGSEEEVRSCGFCRRVKGRSLCYIEMGQQVEWADPRGIWCKPCFTVWRTCLSHITTLTLLPQWLRQAENYDKFFMMRIAYHTLRKESFFILRHYQNVFSKN